MPGRRPRRARAAPALPTQTPPAVAIDQSARAITWRGQTTHQGDGTLPGRGELPVTGLGGPGPADHTRDQRHPLQPARPPTPQTDQIRGTSGTVSLGVHFRLD